MGTFFPREYKDAVSTDSPSSGFPSEPAGTPQHRAPGRDPRPRSALAIWTLVTTILFGIGGLFTLMPLALVPAVLLGVIGLFRIKPQFQRGNVMVIVSLIVAMALGLFAYMGASTMHEILDHVGGGALAALGSDEPDRVDKWLSAEAREDGAAELLHKRFAAAVEAFGPYQNDLELPSLWLGGVAVVAPPTDIEELGAGVGEAWTLRPGAFWMKAVFRDGLVHVELYLGETAQEGMQKAAEDAGGQVASPVLRDLRFFKDKD